MLRPLLVTGMLCLIGSCAAAGLWPAWHHQAPSTNICCLVESKPAHTYLGSPSCSSQSCHGQSATQLTGSESQVWIEQDPHAKSLRVLFSEDSARMIQVLRKSDPSRPQHAAQDQTCLSCHAVSYQFADSQPNKKATLTEGVSCEACHGPAQAWLSEHMLPTWKARNSVEKQKQFGFIFIKDLGVRIGQCTACHIGSADGQVTHDLIAAGHPRLAFEYTRFHYAPHYGKHWIEQENNSAFEIRAWFLGQVVSMRTAIDLLRSRLQEIQAAETNNRTSMRPWPELADRSCYACHRSINSSRIQSQTGGTGKRTVGLAGWNLWYFSLLDMLQLTTPTLFPETTAPELNSLKELLELMQTNSSQTDRLLKLCIRAADELQHWQDQLQKGKLNDQAARQVLHNIATHSLTAAGDRDYDWDFVTQHYLACAALVHAHANRQDSFWGNEVKPLVEQLRLALKFPDDQGMLRQNSPEDYDPVKVKKIFQQLQNLSLPSGSK